jgi:adenosyl cobinamide kinase/adenosyl cobinamide phosphate guanylyltransferase
MWPPPRPVMRRCGSGFGSIVPPGGIAGKRWKSLWRWSTGCVTLWLTNLLLDLDEDPQRVLAEVDRLIAVLPHISAPVHIVTNEVGYGIVPENRLARIFRDLAGEANQRLAAASSEAWLVVSGLPVRLK